MTWTPFKAIGGDLSPATMFRCPIWWLSLSIRAGLRESNPDLAIEIRQGQRHQGLSMKQCCQIVGRYDDLVRASSHQGFRHLWPQLFGVRLSCRFLLAGSASPGSKPAPGCFNALVSSVITSYGWPSVCACCGSSAGRSINLWKYFYAKQAYC